MDPSSRSNELTINAVKDSISHWEQMRDERNCGEVPDASFCALCDLFNNDCRQCPVMIVTGETDCVDTPFYEARIAFEEGSDEVWREAAQKEIDFLKSLLPEEES